MKKYKHLHPPLVERILAEERGKKDPEKAAKTRLHQMYGAYMNGSSHKKAAAVLQENIFLQNSTARNLRAVESVAEKILRLHASTAERLPHYRAFYEFVAANTCEIKKIADLGCGFNPFSIPFAPEEFAENLEIYHAYDIDCRTRDLLNGFFAGIGLPAAAKCADLGVETPAEPVDIAFMLKLLPVLEAQATGRGFSMANAQNTRFLVISFPTKSLSGREKGMEKNYAAAFEKARENGLLDNFAPTASARIGNELIYVLRAMSTGSKIHGIRQDLPRICI